MQVRDGGALAQGGSGGKREGFHSWNWSAGFRVACGGCKIRELRMARFVAQTMGRTELPLSQMGETTGKWGCVNMEKNSSQSLKF